MLFVFEQKTSYELQDGLVGLEMQIRERKKTAFKIEQSGNYIYTKKLEKDKIDPTVALTMALEMAVSDEV